MSDDASGRRITVTAHTRRPSPHLRIFFICSLFNDNQQSPEEWTGRRHYCTSAEVEHVQTLLAANAIDADCEDGRADAASLI